ncbi:MAG TPA: PAS domain S-box protein [Polyangiaceae bacterium]
MKGAFIDMNDSGGGNFPRDRDTDEQWVRPRTPELRDLALFTLGPRGTVATWSVGAERLIGYTSEEIVGQPVSRFHSPEEAGAGTPDKQLIVAERTGRFDGEGWRVRKDGTKFWATVAITALQDSAGHVVGYVEVTRDTTGQSQGTEQFRLALEAAPTGMLMMDRKGAILLLNSHIERLFGYSREELLGREVDVLVPARFRASHPEFRRDFFAAPRARPMGRGRDLYGLRKDGTEVPIEIGLNPIRTADGDFVLCSVIDITERTLASREREELLSQLRGFNAVLEERVRERTAELSATIQEREVLLQEIHHRVKNNLQIISSLVNLQLRQLSDASGRSALLECQTRIQTIALIHEKLYQFKDYSRVPFSEYVRSLAGSVLDATGVAPGVISLRFEVDAVSLTLEQAIPCGLILNELITNAIKHAFPGERRGTMTVILRKQENRILLAVGDDGVGMGVIEAPAASSSLGMQLVKTLVQQLDGELEITRNQGTWFRITFPLDSDSSPRAPKTPPEC